VDDGTVGEVNTEKGDDLELQKTKSKLRKAKKGGKRGKTHSRERLSEQLQQVDLIRVQRVALLAHDVGVVERGNTLEEGRRHAEFAELGLEGMGRGVVVDVNGACSESESEYACEMRLRRKGGRGKWKMENGRKRTGGERREGGRECREGKRRTGWQLETLVHLVSRSCEVVLLERFEPLSHNLRTFVGEQEATVALKHLQEVKKSQ
jgi:hypothetical protein